MKNLLVGILFLIIVSCTKQNDNSINSLMLTGIQGSKGSEMVTIKLDSGVVNTTPVECYVLGSTVFDPTSRGYGYVDCDSVFRLVNPETGNLLRSIKLPGYLSQAVIDSNDNVLIGIYTVISYETNPVIYTNYVIRVNLESGTIVSQNQVDLGDGVIVCTNYYEQEEKSYVMLRADYKLITINTFTGTVVKTVYIGKILNNIVYNPDNKTLIGLTYSLDTDRNYIEVFDPETGSQISSVEIKQRDDYYACISGYDAESDCYILVNHPQNEVLFIDISSGEIEISYKLEYPMNDIKFWRRK